MTIDAVCSTGGTRCRVHGANVLVIVVVVGGEVVAVRLQFMGHLDGGVLALYLEEVWSYSGGNGLQ